MSESLLQIADEMSELLALVDAEMEATGGDVSEGSRGAVLMEKVAGMDLKVREKLDAFATVIRVMELDAGVLREEAARLTDRAMMFLNKGKRLKGLLQYAMLQLGTRRLDGLKFTASIQAHGGNPPLKIKAGVTPETVPSRFQKIELSIDKAKVQAALKDGDPEALKIAQLQPRGESVRIR